MFKKILVPVDLAEPELAKPAIETAIAMARASQGSLRIVNVLPMTPVMLAEYVPPDFDVQQRKSAEDGLKKLVEESGLDPSRVSGTVRQGGIYHEVIEEAKAVDADLIVMTSHRPDMRSYFLGSNAGHVVRYASCSVLVLRD
jgi:nucleotide-binding universal stress UspA family protein